MKKPVDDNQSKNRGRELHDIFERIALRLPAGTSEGGQHHSAQLLSRDFLRICRYT
ncbi:hypothetical protein DAPPUDRAFT_233975 [Daphnia pulex]|uniref:Uncharacterized protein n=1 Tax=Daphnia pulex TaxID=6669 RepID=E9FW93_DAPPU|nr:hypothetical protein DAPPUDRAFT_233975 [Daphnia pulex]|eukprot:EFX88685.1 hypothetical protein DAPPUDRAFT_233975 [Daphnia pulex]